MTDLEDQGDYVCFTSQVGRFVIIDATNLASPYITGEYDIDDAVLNVKIHGTYAYLACGPSGLRIVDVSDPTDPVFVSR